MYLRKGPPASLSECNACFTLVYNILNIKINKIRRIDRKKKQFYLL